MGVKLNKLKGEQNNGLPKNTVLQNFSQISQISYSHFFSSSLCFYLKPYASLSIDFFWMTKDL